MKITLQTPPPPPPTQCRSSMSAISQLLLTRFWWNFKGRFLGTSRTDSNCLGDICPRNICPRNICPYQEYLSCYWPNFNETLKVGSWEHLEQISTVTMTFVQTTFVQVCPKKVGFKKKGLYIKFLFQVWNMKGENCPQKKIQDQNNLKWFYRTLFFSKFPILFSAPKKGRHKGHFW